ncbi:MAG: phosphoribosylglycinamide formyltransferase [Chloroflexota bacterium]|nr:phosphoribosylglycinamide formyltransferase [Chloroflexota bacterium]
MRLAILVSGRGTNLAAVLEAVAEGRLSDVEPVLVVSNRPGVPALDVAAGHGVPTRVLPRARFADAGARDAAIGRAVAEAGADLALLAGYDQLLRPAYFAEFGGRTINIHPSLLPKHGGPGMMGLAVHASVLAAGDTQTGVTIHEVTPELDGGPVITQVNVAVLAGDTPERLAERVLAVEHRCLVEVLAHLSASMTAASRA